MDAILGGLANYGLPGAIIALLAFLLIKKDRDLTREREAHSAELKVERDGRIADSKGYLDLALKLQSQVIDAVNKLADVFDEVKKLIPTQRRGP